MNDLNAKITIHWKFTTALDYKVDAHTATLLQDGTVLIAGGWTEDKLDPAKSYATDACRIFLPTADRPIQCWKHIDSLKVGRSHFTATLLKDGRVLVAGGYAEDGGKEQVLKSIEIYDPATENWQFDLPPMDTSRFDHTATLLQDGTVLITGGDQSKSDTQPTNVTELFDPSANDWIKPLPQKLDVPRAVHAAVLIEHNGSVVVAGGYDKDGKAVGETEIYDPGKKTWTPGKPLKTSRYDFANLSLQKNQTRIIAAGGLKAEGSYIKDSEEFSVHSGTTPSWEKSKNQMTHERAMATACRLQSGHILLIGGEAANKKGYKVSLNSVEIFDPDSKTPWVLKPAHPMQEERVRYASVVLNDGTVLVVGGCSHDGKGGMTLLDTAERGTVF